MRKRFGWGVILSLTVITSFAAPSTAAAQESLAASCPGPRENTVTNGSDNDRLAQIFVPTMGGNLTRAEIDYQEPAGKTGNYVIQILAVDGTGTPTDTVLAQTTAADLPDGTVTTLNAVFSNPAAVVAGQTYALALSRPGSGLSAFLWGMRNDTAACPGKIWFQIGGTGPWNGSFTGEGLFSVFVSPPAEPQPQPQPQPQPEPEPQPPAKADGTLTIDANKGRVEKGRKVTLSGQYDTPFFETCEDNRTVEIQRRFKSESDSEFATFASVQTDDDGNYSTVVKVKKTYFYRAVVGETDACDDETSSSQKVRVQKNKAAQEA
jgi:hypothetical protein